MAQQYKQLLLQNQICFPLYACARKIVAEYTPYLKPLGLTYTQYIVFMVLWEKQSVTAGQLGSILHLDAGTLTPLLKHLEKDGYVTRKRSKDDERVTNITITQKGEELKEKCKDIPLALVTAKSNCGEGLTEEETKTLYKLLYKLLDQDSDSKSLQA